MKQYTHTVVKPFFAQERQDIVQPGEGLTPMNAGRAQDLERENLIRRGAPQILEAPANKAKRK